MGWLLFLTGAYAWVSLPALRHSGYLGVAGARPALALATMVGVVGLVAHLLGRAWLVRLHVQALILAIVTLVLVLALGGGALLAMGVVLWILLVSWGGGNRVLSAWFGQRPDLPGAERGALAMALGLGLASHLTLALSLIGLLRWWVFATLLLGATVLLHRELLAGTSQTVRSLLRLPAALADSPRRWYELPLWSLLGAWLCFWLVHSVAPEIQYDSLNYHLNLPRLWIEAGHLFSTPSIIQSYYYLGAEASFTLAMMLGGQAAAKLISLTFAGLTCAALYALARRLGSRGMALVAVSLFVACPIVGWEASTTYVDVVLACYCVLTLAAALRWHATRDTRWLALAGVMAGFGVSVKLNAVIFFIPLFLILTGLALAASGTPLATRLKGPLALAATSIAVSLPWPLLRFAQTRSPVFPFLNTLFRSPLAPATTHMTMFTIFGVGTTAQGLARLPWAMTFTAGKFGEALPANVIGVSLLVLPLLLLMRRVPRPMLLVTASSLTYLVLWAYSAQYLRYLIPALPGICLVAAFLLETLERGVSGATARIASIAAPLVAIVLVLLGLPAYAATFFQISERIPWRVAVGLERREAYLERTVPAVPAYRFLSTLMSREPVRALAIGDESRLYFPGSLETLSSPCMKVLYKARTPQELAGVVRDQGFTHLVVNRNKFSSPPKWLNVAHDAFLDRHTELLFAARRFEVYRIVTGERPAAHGRKPSVEMLTNGGLEQMQASIPTGWQALGKPTVDCSGKASRTGKCAVLAIATSGLTQRIAVTPGRLYTLSHFSRSESPECQARGQINWLDKQGRVLESTVAVWGSGSAWTENRLHQTAPEGAVTAVVYATTQRGAVWLDDVSLREMQ